MFLAHQPADVSEEEAAIDVVRICVGVAEFVMHSMISDPLDDAVLQGDGLKEQKHRFHLFVGFVGLVTPKAMSASCDTP